MLATLPVLTKGVVQDGCGENVLESQRQVHYDYKNRLEGMMQKFSWMLLLVLAFWAGCQDQPKVQEPSTVEQKSKPVAAQLSEEEMVVGSAEELKTVSAKNITWKKDGAKMVQIPYEVKTYDRIGNPVSFFYMDTTEVTVDQFKKFLVQTDHIFDSDLWGGIHEISSTDEHPMIMVDWHDATAYAK